MHAKVVNYCILIVNKESFPNRVSEWHTTKESQLIGQFKAHCSAFFVLHHLESPALSVNRDII